MMAQAYLAASLGRNLSLGSRLHECEFSEFSGRERHFSPSLHRSLQKRIFSLDRKSSGLSCPPLKDRRTKSTRVWSKPNEKDANFPSSKDEENYSSDSDQDDILSRIASGEFTVSKSRVDRSKGLRKALSNTAPGRFLAKTLVEMERDYRKLFPLGMPEARGDVRAIVGQPFFIPLYSLFLVYGGVFRLSFGPKQFTIVSDPAVAKHILKDNAKSYSKGILAEILDFVMGTGLIPSDGEVWKVRRRAIVPALHKKYVAAMVSLFSSCSDRLCQKLEIYTKNGESVEMESLFSRLTLDVIGKAVFNYDFDSLSKDKGITEAVYVALREAEIRSTAPIPYWNIFPIQYLLPRLRKVNEALVLINDTLDELIGICKEMVEKEDEAFYEEYVNTQDPSILHFLIASGDEVSSKQLRDDLMTLLIAGHETSAAVLTWTFYLLSKHPEVVEKLEAEVDEVLGDRYPEVEDLRKLTYTLQVINESMRLYPQPPVLIRRALEDDKLSIYPIKKGQDIFISVWNLHRDPATWKDVEKFVPERWNQPDSTPFIMSEKFSFLPFGGGPRKCVGDQFAIFELITALAILVRRFRFELAPDAPPVEMTTGATIHTTKGLLMGVSARTTSSPSLSPLNGSPSNIVLKLPEEDASSPKETIPL